MVGLKPFQKKMSQIWLNGLKLFVKKKKILQFNWLIGWLVDVQPFYEDNVLDIMMTCNFSKNNVLDLFEWLCNFSE